MEERERGTRPASDATAPATSVAVDHSSQRSGRESEAERQMAVGRRILKKRHAVLAELAK